MRGRVDVIRGREYVWARAVRIRRSWVREQESRLSGKFVDESDKSWIPTINALDQALRRYWEQHRKYPEYITLLEDGLCHYIPVPLPMQICGMTVPIKEKPVYFRVPRVK